MKTLYDIIRKHCFEIDKDVRNPKVVLAGSSHTLDNSVKQYSLLREVLTCDDALALEGLTQNEESSISACVALLKSTVENRDVADSARMMSKYPAELEKMLQDIASLEESFYGRVRPHIGSLVSSAVLIPALFKGSAIYGIDNAKLIKGSIANFTERGYHFHAQNKEFASRIREIIPKTKGTIWALMGISHLKPVSELLDYEHAVIRSTLKPSERDIGLYLGFLCDMVISLSLT